MKFCTINLKTVLLGKKRNFLFLSSIYMLGQPMNIEEYTGQH
jgi:hypothetical protein